VGWVLLGQVMQSPYPLLKEKKMMINSRDKIVLSSPHHIHLPKFLKRGLIPHFSFVGVRNEAIFYHNSISFL
jgi:hypothetical protein